MMPSSRRTMNFSASWWVTRPLAGALLSELVGDPAFGWRTTPGARPHDRAWQLRGRRQEDGA